MFRIELSYRLGRTLRELEATLTVEELVLYAVAEGIEPRGEARADLRAGIIAAAASNPYRKKNAPPFKPADFIPKFRRQKQNMGLLKKQLMAYTLKLGGTVTEIPHVN